MKNLPPAFLRLCLCLLFFSHVTAFAENDPLHPKTDSVANGSGEQFNITLYLLNPDSSIKAADGDVVQYDSSYSAGVDIFDALKFINFNETLGLLRDGYLLTIERRPVIGITDTLFLNLTRSSQRSYMLRFTATALNHPGLFGFLKDSYTGDSALLDLNGTTDVDFSINGDVASQDPNRFMVVFEPIATGGVVPVTFSNIKASRQNNNVSIEWNVENQSNIKNYVVERSADGVVFTQIAIIEANKNLLSTYNWVDKDPAAKDNYYRVRFTGSNGSVQYSSIVKITISDGMQIAVFPNPVKNGVVNLRMKGQSAGNYIFYIINNTGQVVQTNSLKHLQGSLLEKIIFDKKLIKGAYFIKVIDPENQCQTLTLQYR